MREFTFRAAVTVSCWTTISAETEEEAREIAEERELACLNSCSFSESEREAWHFDNDGAPQNINLED